MIELISWIDCSLVDKLNKLKTQDDDATEDFDERLRIAQTFRDMGNVRLSDGGMREIVRGYSRTNTPSRISNEQFVSTPRESNSY